jgi:hypothetical protein
MQVSDKTITYCLWIVNNGAGILTDEKVRAWDDICSTSTAQSAERLRGRGCRCDSQLIGLGRRAVFKYFPTLCSRAPLRILHSTSPHYLAPESALLARLLEPTSTSLFPVCTPSRLT